MEFWYRPRATWPAHLLSPLSGLMGLVVRHRAQRRHAGHYSAPVLVVGNIAVGGTGKSPAIQAIVRALTARGLHCGIVSRGYGGSAHQYPYPVRMDSPVAETGDEPLLLARSLRCPVVVDPDRDRAIRFLLDTHEVDVVISDDGLQHYRMGRDFELVMVDGHRGLGNGRLLPAGPLREPPSRLRDADWIVAKARAPAGLDVDAVLALNPTRPSRHDGSILPEGTEVDVCAGIGHPEAFLEQIRSQGYRVRHLLAPGDHKAIPRERLDDASVPLILTEKDAIKLSFPWPEHCYVARLEPELPTEFIDQLEDAIRRYRHG